MKEIYVSLATLVGLIGLVVLYDNGQAIQNRFARDVNVADFSSPDQVFEAINEQIDRQDPFDVDLTELNGDLEFLKALGWFDKQADDGDIPMLLQEDVAMLQSPTKGKVKSSVSFIVKCLLNAVCKIRAEKTVKSWGRNYRSFMESHFASYLQTVTTAYTKDGESQPFGICTPKDDIIPCHDVTQRFVATPNVGDGPMSSLSANAEQITVIEGIRSSQMNETLASINVAEPGAQGNVFGQGPDGVRMLLVMPNGVPISMADTYKVSFVNYWGFFKDFNNRYIGVNKQKPYKNRNDIYFWFIRMDEKPKSMMKSPVKANKRFPWKRFDNLMTKSQSTAIQPKLKTAYSLILTEADKITSKVKSDAAEGNDCVVFWFHQYLPQDLAELANPSINERFVAGLDNICTVIHFWVGFQKLADDDNSIKVVQYMQGILQPSQTTKTSIDSDLRGWFYVDDLEALSTENNFNLMQRVYNVIALERKRTRCLLGKETANAAEAIMATEEEVAKESFYYDVYEPDYGWNTTAGTSTVSAPYTTTQYNFWNTTASWSTAPSQVNLLPPDWGCCGIGFQGEKYDINVSQCCKNGLVPSGEYCA